MSNNSENITNRRSFKQVVRNYLCQKYFYIAFDLVSAVICSIQFKTFPIILNVVVSENNETGSVIVLCRILNFSKWFIEDFTGFP